jgi:dTMP kinase
MLKIEFSGTDGAGKSTGMSYFVSQARELGFRVVESKEVGNPNVPACVKMKEFVLDPSSNLSGEAMELIFSAMRFENDRWFRGLINGENAPNLVVSDRGLFDHLAYTDHNVSPKFTELLYSGVVQPLTAEPDVVIYFSVDTQTALKRRVKRGTVMDVIEMKGIEYQEKVRESFEKYLSQSLESGGNIQVFLIDANQSLENVESQLDQILDHLVGSF